MVKIENLTKADLEERWAGILKRINEGPEDGLPHEYPQYRGDPMLQRIGGTSYCIHCGQGSSCCTPGTRFCPARKKPERPEVLIF